MYKEKAPLLPAEWIERARRLNVPLLCDGAKAAGVGLVNDGCMEAAIGPVVSDMKVLGTALTVETGNGDNYPIHMAAYLGETEGYVLVIDGKAYAGRAYLGDLIMYSCQAAGYEGVVLDGYSRDKEGNEELKFPVFSRGLMPRGPIKKEPGNINIPIQCGSIPVCPGDLVMGDSDGVCVIPRKHVETVLEKAEEKSRYEIQRREAITAYQKAKANGQPLPELAPKWVLDMMSTISR